MSIVGMIVGATAQHINQLIGANLLNGISAAGQLSFGIIMGELVPNKLRGPAITIIFLSSLPFAVFGPSIARALILHTAAGWRWSYYIGIIISTSSLVLYQFFYHPPSYDQLHVHGKTRWQMFKELDFVGILLFLVGTIVFLIGLSWGGGTYPWKSAHVIATLVVGGLTLIAFGLYGTLCYMHLTLRIFSNSNTEEFVFKGQALMPPRLFRKVGFVAIVFVATVGAMVYYSLTVLFPTILSTVYGLDTVQVGIQSSIVGGGVLLGQTIGGFSLAYVPKIKYQTIIYSVLAATFVASLASLHSSGHTAFVILSIFATGKLVK